MFPCIYDPGQHEILNPPLLEWCRARLDNPKERDRLFVYHHRLHDTFVIARWAQDPMGVFTDFLNLGHSLGNFDEKMADEFLHRMFKPLDPIKMNKTLQESANAGRREAEEKNEEMKEVLARRKMIPGSN